MDLIEHKLHECSKVEFTRWMDGTRRLRERQKDLFDWGHLTGGGGGGEVPLCLWFIQKGHDSVPFSYLKHV